IPVIEVPEDTVPCAGREHDRIGSRAAIDESHIPKREEECFVLYDRPAIAARELVRIAPIRFRGFPPACQWIDLSVVVPCIRVKRAVSTKPDCRTAVLVRARACEKLKLGIAAAHLRIDGSHYNADF